MELFIRVRDMKGNTLHEAVIPSRARRDIEDEIFGIQGLLWALSDAGERIGDELKLLQSEFDHAKTIFVSQCLEHRQYHEKMEATVRKLHGELDNERGKVHKLQSMLGDMHDKRAESESIIQVSCSAAADITAIKD